MLLFSQQEGELVLVNKFHLLGAFQDENPMIDSFITYVQTQAWFCSFQAKIFIFSAVSLWKLKVWVGTSP